MRYSEKLQLMKEFIYDNVIDVHDLVNLLDISIEDLLNVFPDKLVEHYEQTIGADEEEAEPQDNGTGEEWEE